jgi:hypothetical protein
MFEKIPQVGRWAAGWDGAGARRGKEEATLLFLRIRESEGN